MKISELEKSIMLKWFPVRTNQEMTELLNCTHSRVHRMARELHLTKNVEYRAAWYKQHNFELDMYNRHRHYQAQRDGMLGRTPHNKIYNKPEGFEDIVRRYHSKSTAQELAEELNVPRYIILNWLYESGACKDKEERKRLSVNAAKKMGMRNAALHTNNHKKIILQQ